MNASAPDAWVDGCLASAGLARTSELTLFRERPWATVWSAETTGGRVWLKRPGPDTAFEVGLYAVLRQAAPEHVLDPLGVDAERSLLLLPDGGPPLADTHDGEARIAAMEAVMPQYAELQRAAAGHVESLLAAGVTDMRAAVMPERFEQALAQIAGSEHVAPARERFGRWCEQLAAAPGGATIDHNDLHAHNILPGADGRFRFYDWGDAVVAHPFASMLVGLGFIPYVYKCPPDDPRVLRVRDAYLEAFTDLAPRPELVSTLEIACRVAKVARALVWLRAVRATPDADPEWTTAPLESLASVLDDGYL